ncbi:MAG: hypothetical protein OEZ57_03760 [Nitrospirota bacterium]|nr:hypothetical protein [Nitrospirota bacterium]MDH5586552.1 hypothetical protein [Nitrospirota bacterium]MDH5774015.1 hypothetical protein [Nitrospirota bacterium]
MPSDLIVLNVMGPFREPREPAFSYDYSVQRPNWATAQGVRIKVSIEHELDFLKHTILEISGGSVGQQMRCNQLLVRAIADQKLEIVDSDGQLSERLDVMIGPFEGDTFGHLFSLLEQWMRAEKVTLRQLMKDQVGL